MKVMVGSDTTVCWSAESSSSPSAVLSSAGGPAAIAEAYLAKPHLEHSTSRSRKGGKLTNSHTGRLDTPGSSDAEQLLHILYRLGPSSSAQAAFKGSVTAAFVRLCELVA